MTKAQDSLKYTIQLLRMEKEADMEQYKEKIQLATMEERKKSGVTWYPVQVSDEGFSMGEKPVVKLQAPKGTPKNHLFQSGKLVSLFEEPDNPGHQRKSINGVINNVKDHEMVVTFNADELPAWVHHDDVGIDLLFDEAAYNEMERAVKEVIHTHNQALIHLRETLLGGEAATFGDIHPVEIDRLNKGQNEALNLVLRAGEVGIIHGPPGTGKTTTLVEAIQQTLKQEKKVLVCAPSNAAVDLLTEKLMQRDINVLRMGHPARVTEELLSHTIDAKISAHDSYKDLKGLRRKSEELRSTALKYKRKYGKAERDQRRRLLDEASRMRDDAEMLEHYIWKDTMDQTQVITCTLVGASSNMLKGLKFQTVFIDEASQALEPACWIPLLKTQRVILAGDHYQLPPTVKSREAAGEGLASTLFEKCIEQKRKSGTPVDVMLRTQYRMHQQIMEFPARIFYQDRLEAHPSVKEKLLAPEIAPMLYVDTAGCGYEEEKEPETLSTFNRDEGLLLFMHLEGLIHQLGVEHVQEQNFSIGIITPYKAQVRLLENSIADFPELMKVRKQITIDSVDGFQGRERDIVYISLVRNNTTGEIGFLGDTRRMNVAMTRARMRLVLLGDSATLGENAFYSDLLDYVQETAAYQSAFELIY